MIVFGRAYRWGTLVLGVLVATGLVVTAGPADAARSGVTAKQQLVNAPIPASCRHQATTLKGFARQWGPDGRRGSASLDVDQAVFTALGGGTKSYAVVPFSCDAGGVSWPQWLLVYDRGPHLVGGSELPGNQEHATIDSLSAHGGTVRVRWSSYEGAGFDIVTWSSALTLKKGKVHFARKGPMTIDFTDNGLPSTTFGIYDGTSTRVLNPAPKALKKFMAKRFTPHAGPCSDPPGREVQLLRYSHKGYATALRGRSCITAQYELYAKNAKGWKVIASWDYYDETPMFYCNRLTPQQTRGLTATGGRCRSAASYDPYDVTPEILGNWPKLGQ